MSGLEVLVALAIAVGLAGVLVPVLPGTLLVGAAILLWAVERGGAAWIVLVVALALLATGSVVKYLVPGRRLRRAGVPASTLLAGAAVGVVGFFVVPVVGLVLGFVLGVYLVELRRLGHTQAWPATVSALKAVGLGVAIELTFAVLAAATWAVGVVVT
ncbi:DUF456 domain-containing protein [Nocardioides pocheonensis]|uniref:DUF456 domain-containing protein n=1 Tax=Nocardioides pocheonensis TaxID=661485 RepID=A0A3N0GUF6_9ACTN|nr:DUF456 domain-containing protein [Nocardioides pocheonensis]RNM16059.1 DUF456 domain-containing protein [Nocardioides pocheonensis]